MEKKFKSITKFVSFLGQYKIFIYRRNTEMGGIEKKTEKKHFPCSVLELII